VPDAAATATPATEAASPFQTDPGQVGSEPTAPAAVGTTDTGSIDPAQAPGPGGAPDAAPAGGIAPVAGGGGDSMGYDLGRQLGARTVQSAWRNLSPDGSCDAVDRLSDAIGRSSGRVMDHAARFDQAEMVNYAEGYVHGLHAGLEEVAGRCADRCQRLCEAAGTATRVVYCDALLRRPFPALRVLQAAVDRGPRA
jgi:hypothetical protein